MLKELFSEGEDVFNKNVLRLHFYFAVYSFSYLITPLTSVFSDDPLIVFVSASIQISVALYALYKMGKSLNKMISVFHGIVSIPRLSCEIDVVIEESAKESKKTKKSKK
jgi:hypothetical protein